MDLELPVSNCQKSPTSTDHLYSPKWKGIVGRHMNDMMFILYLQYEKVAFLT